MHKRDLTGLKFNMLTVESFAYIRDSHAYWNCVCDCGKKTVVCGSRLMRNTTKSCGCLGPKMTRQRAKREGFSTTRLHRIYTGIKTRCYNKKSKDYKNYGGRGIVVYKEWLENPLAFRDWALSNGYKENLSIDRIDVNGNYEPSNCRWSTVKQQGNNRRSNLLITWNGETKTAAEWCAEKGWNRHIIPERLRKGWSLEKAMTTPRRTRGV